MNTTSPDFHRAHHLVGYGNRLFSQAAECLRQANASLAAGDAHEALGLQKQAFRSFEGADVCYARGHAVTGLREARRRRCIAAVVRVNIHALVPLPLPGENARAEHTHRFKVAQLVERGRKAVRRSQVTRGVARLVTEDQKKRAILDRDGVWQDSIGCVVSNERQAAVRVWRDFVKAASHCIAGWRCEELLGELPGLLAGQVRRIDEAFSKAVAANPSA